jgi:enoyl-CoA hydratase/carnithine racemase
MPVLTSSHDGLVELTLDRPDRRNALDLEMWHALRDAARAADGARAVIVRGAGAHFCSGMDLSAGNPLLGMVAPALTRGDEVLARAVIEDLKSCVQALADLPCLTIAAIEGACLGGGLEVALACDMRIAASNAVLSMPEARVGLMSDVGGAVRLTRLVGPGRAADLLATGRAVDGEQAFRLGLVERVVTPGTALEVARAAAADVRGNAPEAVRLALSVVRLAPDLGLPEALSLETRAGVMALTTGKALEGIAAFQERRPPRWGG